MKENLNLAIKWLFGISVLFIMLSFMSPLIQMAMTITPQTYDCTLEPVAGNSQTCKSPVVLEHKIVKNSECNNKNGVVFDMAWNFLVLGIVCLAVSLMLAICSLIKCERENELNEKIKSLGKKVNDLSNKPTPCKMLEDAKLKQHEEILALIKAVGKVAEDSGHDVHCYSNTQNFKEIVDIIKELMEKAYIDNLALINKECNNVQS